MMNDIKEPWNLIVPQHAIERYKERAKVFGRSDFHIAHTLRQLCISGCEMELKPDKRLRQLLAHDCKPARYFKGEKVLIVVEDRTIITIHEMTADKWIKKETKP